MEIPEKKERREIVKGAENKKTGADGFDAARRDGRHTIEYSQHFRQT